MTLTTAPSRPCLWRRGRSCPSEGAGWLHGCYWLCCPEMCPGQMRPQAVPCPCAAIRAASWQWITPPRRAPCSWPQDPAARHRAGQPHWRRQPRRHLKPAGPFGDAAERGSSRQGRRRQRRRRGRGRGGAAAAVQEAAAKGVGGGGLCARASAGRRWRRGRERGGGGAGRDAPGCCLSVTSAAAYTRPACTAESNTCNLTFSVTSEYYLAAPGQVFSSFNLPIRQCRKTKCVQAEYVTSSARGTDEDVRCWNGRQQEDAPALTAGVLRRARRYRRTRRAALLLPRPAGAAGLLAAGRIGTSAARPGVSARSRLSIASHTW